MKYDIISKQSVPENGRFVLPEMAQLYREIGRMDVNHALKIEEKTPEALKIRDRIGTYYGGKRSSKRFGFSVKVRIHKDVPAAGFSTIYVTKIEEGKTE